MLKVHGSDWHSYAAINSTNLFYQLLFYRVNRFADNILRSWHEAHCCSRAYAFMCVYMYIYCLILCHELFSICSIKFSSDNTAAIKLKFTNCDRELAMPLIPRARGLGQYTALGLHSWARVPPRSRVIFPGIKRLDVIIFQSGRISFFPRTEYRNAAF